MFINVALETPNWLERLHGFFFIKNDRGIELNFTSTKNRIL